MGATRRATASNSGAKRCARAGRRRARGGGRRRDAQRAGAGVGWLNGGGGKECLGEGKTHPHVPPHDKCTRKRRSEGCPPLGPRPPPPNFCDFFFAARAHFLSARRARLKGHPGGNLYYRCVLLHWELVSLWVLRGQRLHNRRRLNSQLRCTRWLPQLARR